MSKNNDLLHACAAASFVGLLVYSGEQWRGGVNNVYMKCAIWTSASGISIFVMSFIIGFLNESISKTMKKYNVEHWFLYDCHYVDKIELSSSDARKFEAEAQYSGWYACLATYTSRIERTFTFVGAILLIATAIFFAAGVLTK